MYSVYKISLFILSLSIMNSCTRENPTEIVDDGLPPSVPERLSVYFANDGEIGIEWSTLNEEGLAGYQVYRASSDPDSLKKYVFVSKNYFYDDSLDYNLTYYYAISAVDIFNRESSRSLLVNATPLNYYRPYRIIDISINAQNRNNNLKVRLEWRPSPETDILGYQIYRDQIENFKTDSVNFHSFTKSTYFLDSTDLNVLEKYYYKIITVDKGMLVSEASAEISDVILDRPMLIFPENNTGITYPFLFRIETASLPAKYRLVIQSNELTGVLFDYYFESDKIKEQLQIQIPNYSYEEYKTYYWKIYTYTGSLYDPNSDSDLFSFKIISKTN